MNWARDSIGKSSRPERVFCASFADWLDDEVDPLWLFELFELIYRTPNLNWLLLTKRPQNWRHRMTAARNAALYDFNDVTDRIDAWLSGESLPFRNIWIGTSVEDQARADERIPLLLNIPARVRFLSCEPLLEKLELSNVTKRSDCVNVLGKFALEGIHWVICGGESGPSKRYFNPDWARSLRDQCAASGTKFFMKQIDKVQPIPDDLMIRKFPA